ncbi:hypothetical protein J3E72DRAFT_278925 [Bipolaris maydis]|nr:hypothetical protein J3E74DRAFT_389836 [Bipolaris maydis]KAJ5059226.1 hypothetical protein J3E74DRAFT_356632 [Bipolaris maydis]KAJ6202801.1 hypothetical protein J3E72DRAFT_278925 [Bipolaris maydis]KAJ6209215.1 hypothetical protein PSV09DRAFT_2316381 [Bipolaris maydis]
MATRSQIDKLTGPARSPTDCGNNYTTAIAAGCIFDFTAVKWMAPECHNATLSKSLASKVPKPMFFLSKNLTEPLSEDPLEISQHDQIWSHHEYHAIHCTYMLQLAATAAVMVSSGHHNVFLNSFSANADHIAHCSRALSNPVPDLRSVHIPRPGSALHCNIVSL